MTVVITGASAGIGRAAAVSFARRGWRVVLLAGGTSGPGAPLQAFAPVNVAALAQEVVGASAARPQDVDLAMEAPATL